MSDLRAPERSWRHLDTMQFATEIRAAVPRCRCTQCGVKTIQVPWASKHSRFTLMFEAFAIRVIQASANVKKAAELLGLSWDATHRIMEAALERGLDRRKAEPVPNIGIDEKSFAKGQSSISVMTDINGSRVLEVAPERTIVACDSLWKSLTFDQLSSVESVALDMWPAFMTSTMNNVPEAKIVHDNFHIAKYLGEAVDKSPITAGKKLSENTADCLEGYQQVSIGERLRTLDGEPVDTSRWLSPLELAGETDGEPVKVVNRLTPEELDELVNAGAERPLGCLPMRLEEYAELLRWLAGNPPQANAAAGPADSSAASAEAAGGSVAILRRLFLDPAAFADLVGNFGKRFSTAVGCPESLKREALRRGRRRLRAPGGPALARRHPKPPTQCPAL